MKSDKLELNLKHSSLSVERLESHQNSINSYHTHNWWNFALVPFLSFLWCKGHMSQVEEAFYSLLISTSVSRGPLQVDRDVRVISCDSVLER